MTAAVTVTVTAVLVVVAAARVVARLWQHRIETDMDRWSQTKGRG